jgi:hypothetical protein
MNDFQRWLSSNGYEDELGLYNELSIPPGQHELVFMQEQLEYLRTNPVPREPQLTRASSSWLSGPWDYNNEVNKRNNEIAELENQINELSQPLPYEDVKSIVTENVRYYRDALEGGGLRRISKMDNINRETMDKYDKLWRAMSEWEGRPEAELGRYTGFGSTKALNADIKYLRNL